MEVPTIPGREAFRFRLRRRTRWCDEDNQGVVNNAVYLTLLEEARFEYFDGLGLIEEHQFPFVLMQTNIRFLHPGRGEQELEIELKTTGLGRSSLRQVARIRAVEGGAVLAEAEVLLVAWCNRTRAKELLSERLREALTRFEGDLDRP